MGRFVEMKVVLEGAVAAWEAGRLGGGLMCLGGTCGMGRSEFKVFVVVSLYWREDTRSFCSDQQYMGGLCVSIINYNGYLKKRIHSL